LGPTAKDKGNQRESGGVRVAGLGFFPWSVCKEKRERKKRERGRLWWFGRNSIEF
jgi:hypothetical protein